MSSDYDHSRRESAEELETTPPREAAVVMPSTTIREQETKPDCGAGERESESAKTLEGS